MPISCPLALASTLVAGGPVLWRWRNTAPGLSIFSRDRNHTHKHRRLEAHDIIFDTFALLQTNLQFDRFWQSRCASKRPQKKKNWYYYWKSFFFLIMKMYQKKYRKKYRKIKMYRKKYRNGPPMYQKKYQKRKVSEKVSEIVSKKISKNVSEKVSRNSRDRISKKKEYRKKYQNQKRVSKKVSIVQIDNLWSRIIFYFLNARQKYRLVRRGRFLFVLTARLHHRSLPRIQILIAAWAIFCLELPEAVESCPSVRKAGMPMLCRVAAYSVPPCRAVSYRVVRPAIGSRELSQWKRLTWPYEII